MLILKWSYKALSDSVFSLTLLTSVEIDSYVVQFFWKTIKWKSYLSKYHLKWQIAIWVLIWYPRCLHLQLFLYLLLSASTSAATVANMSYTGEMGIQLCSRFDVGSFCSKADVAVTMSFFAVLAMLSSTILAIYRIAVLLREYWWAQICAVIRCCAL